MATKKEDESQVDGRERGIGELDTSGWEERKAVTDRPNDTPLTGDIKPAVPNTTFSERSKAASKSTAKAVESDQTENKAVGASKTSRKSS
jgi:hypothetical protein